LARYAESHFKSGLRYDYQTIAKPPIQNPNAALLAAGFDTSFQPKDKNNFAPRLGLSYGFNEKTVLRGGYGIFFARTTAIMTGTAHSQNGIQVVAIDINCRANVQLVNNTLYAFSNAGTVSGTPLPIRLGLPASNFGTARQFISGSPSFTFNSSYNREFQLGARFDF